MIVQEIENQREYNKFITTQVHVQFLQSWEWGDFFQSEGGKVIRLGFYENKKLFFVLSLYKNNLPLNHCYYSAPRMGMESLSAEQLSFVFEEIKKAIKKDRALFLRFEPRSQLKIGKEKIKIEKTIDVQPSKTIILDLNKSEEELLKAMHQKTRYNVRLAKKKGVIIREASDNEKDFEKFWDLMKDTGGRDGFRLHDREHYKKMLSAGGNDFKIKLYFAEYDGKIITANIISFFGDMVTYVHGASSSEYRNVMAPYLLQWYVIRKAKGLGFKFYDFFGVDEARWPGVTRFKRGFEGEEVEYPGTFDFVFNSYFYLAYKLFRKIRRLF